MRFNEEGARGKGQGARQECVRASSCPSPLAPGPFAFSLIEIMIVVVIIGLMAGVISYATVGYLDRAKRVRARSDISTLAGAIDQFHIDKGRYPENSEGLKVLSPQFIKTIQPDPWGHAYVYVQPGRGGTFDVISLGADGREGGNGADADITNWDIEQTKPAGTK